MNIYAEIGQSLQQIGGDCPVGWIVMKTERPDATSVAKKGGKWGPKVLTKEEIINLRANAYKTESDPLKNEAEFDAIVADKQPDYKLWLAKVNEIKQKYPFSTEV